MTKTVASIMLFTLSACPMGRSMGMVMNEIQVRYERIHIEIVYVELQPEEANKYRIKSNPTTLFLNEHQEELYRVEGFAETEVIETYIEQLNEGMLMTAERLAENEASEEEYTIYLRQNEKWVAVKQVYANYTSIKAPRIHAILALLTAEGSDQERTANVFPKHSQLVKLSFLDQTAQVELDLPNARDIGIQQLELMREALQLTLETFEVKNVELILDRKDTE